MEANLKIDKALEAAPAAQTADAQRKIDLQAAAVTGATSEATAPADDMANASIVEAAGMIIAAVKEILKAEEAKVLEAKAAAKGEVKTPGFVIGAQAAKGRETEDEIAKIFGNL